MSEEEKCFCNGGLKLLFSCSGAADTANSADLDSILFRINLFTEPHSFSALDTRFKSGRCLSHVGTEGPATILITQEKGWPASAGGFRGGGVIEYATK